MSFFQLCAQIQNDLKSHGSKGRFLSYFHFFLFNAKFRLMLNYRIGTFLFNKKSRLCKALSKYYKYKQITKRNCQISYSAIIGNNVVFVHPIGIIIGDRVIIKDNVRIWQQVTLGSNGRLNMETEYPIIGENAKIFAGAKVFGNIIIGDNSVIAANAVVNKDVAEGDVVGGIPARSLKNK